MTDDSVGATGSVAEYRGRSSPAKLVEIARYFLFIGLVGFGGPLVHIALMEDDLVGEGSREWTDESIFMEGLAICNMLPGPASTQLGIFMGWIRAGNPGALIAGFFFMLPTFALVVFFSWLYFEFQTLPAVEAAFYGINPVVIGLIAGASYRMARSALGEGKHHAEFDLGSDTWTVDFLLVVLLVGAIVATVVLNPNPVLEFIVAGLVAVAIYRSDWLRANARRVVTTGVVTAMLGGLYLLRDRIIDVIGPRVRGAITSSPFWAIAVAFWSNPWVKLFLFMVYTGSFIYGGGLVLIPFIEKYVVNEFGWLTAREFVDGIAIGQLSPGPVVMTTAFVGYKVLLDASGGLVVVAILGALVATIGAFGPSFVFIMGFFPYFARVRENDVVQTALVGVNAAVVGAILGATVTLATESFVDAFTVVLAVVTFGLFVRGLHAAYLIIGGGVVGVAWFFLVL